MDGAHWVSAGGASLARWRLPAALSPTIQQVAVWGQPARPATDIKDHPVMTQKEEDVPSTATIDRLGSSLPQRTNGVPEGPGYVMDVVRTWVTPDLTASGSVRCAIIAGPVPPQRDSFVSEPGGDPRARIATCLSLASPCMSGWYNPLASVRQPGALRPPTC